MILNNLFNQWLLGGVNRPSILFMLLFQILQTSVPAYGKNMLLRYERLNPGEFITSKNERYKLILDPVGGITIYDQLNFSPYGKWSPTVSFLPGAAYAKSYLVMQEDNNLALYDASNMMLWSTETQNCRSGPAAFYLDDDGVAKIVNEFGIFWQSSNQNGGGTGY